MSRLSRSCVLAWVAALIALLGFSPLATAAVVTWDISASPGITGGSGSWDLTTSNWTSDGGLTNQVWADNDSAVFSIIGTGNIVTVDAAIKASSVQFDAAGYTIAAGTGTFEMTGGASLVVNGNATISAAITGSVGLNISGAAQLDLTAAAGNSYTGGTTISGTTVRLGHDSALSTGTVTINGASTLASNSGTARTIANNLVLNANLTLGQAAGGTGTLTFNGTVDLGGGSRELNTLVTTTLNGAVSNGGIDKAGTGTLILTGTNTYAGATNINAGAIRINSAGALGSTSAVTVVSGARLELDGSITVNRNAVINGNGGNNNGAIQSFSGNPVWSGNITLGSDAARVGAGVSGSTLTVSGVIDSGTNNYGLEVRSASGADVVVLSGANTYLGATTSVVGILRLGANNTLPTGTLLRIGNPSNVDSATVDLNGFNQTVGGLASQGSTMPRTLTNTSGTASTLTINSLSDQTYGALITGNLSIVKDGSFTQTFTAANSYTGTTTVNAGRLEVASAAALPGYGTSGMVTVNNGGTLLLRVGGTGTWSGAEIDTLLGVSPAVFQAGSTLGLNATGAFTYNSDIGGVQKLLKMGASQVNLGGNSTYTGGTSIQAGYLQVTSSNAVGTGDVTIDGTGVRFILANGVNISNNVIANVVDPGAGFGVLQGPSSGTATFSGTFTANVASASGGHIAAGAGATLVIAGPLVHAPGAFVLLRAGNITLANSAGNNTTDLRMMAGNISLGVDNGIDTNAVVTMSHGGGTSATFNLNGFNQSLAGLVLGATDGVATINTGTGTLTLTGNVTSNATAAVTHVINGNLNLGSGTRTFTVGDGTATPDFRIAAVIDNGSLKKDGPGTLDLTAANLYSGGTELAAGVLRLGNDNALGTGLLTVSGSSTLASTSTANRAINVAMKLSADTTIGQTTGGTGRMFLNGAIDLDSGSPRTIATNVHTVVSGVISNGTLRKDGASALVLDAANTHTGGTQLSAGLLLVGNDNALGTGTLTIDGGSTVFASMDNIARVLPNAVTLTADPNFGMMYLGTGDLTFNGNVNLGGFYRTVNTLNDVVFGGNVTNGDLVKSGAGSLSVLGSATVNSVTVNAGLLSLTGANTISSGTVSVNGGALYADDAAALGGATNLTVNTGGALRFGSGAGSTLSSVTSLTGYSNAFFGFGLGTSNDKIDLGSNFASLFGALVGGWDTGTMTVGSTYTVLKAGGGLGVGSVSLGALPGGYVYSLSTTGTQVDITVNSLAPAGPYYWTGDRGDGSWTALGDGTNSNWATDAAGTTDPQATPGAGMIAYFNASSASASPFTVTLDGPVSVQGVKFIATTPATGAVTINAGANNGTLTLGSAGLEALTGAPSPTINAPVVIGADQYWNTVVGVTMNGRLSGSANLTKIGGGTLTIDSAAFTAPADFSGELRVYQGTLTARAPAVTAADLYVVNPFGDGVIRLANSTLNIRYDGPNDSTNRDYIFGNQLIVDKPATISLDRISGTGGSNRNSIFSSLTINNTQLTVSQTNTFRLAISGNINLVGDAVISTGDLTNMASGKITDAGLMRTLVKTGGNTMNILGTGNDFGGGMILVGSGVVRIGDGYGTAAVNPTATAGTGPVVVAPGTGLFLYDPGNVAVGQTIDVVSRNNAFAKLGVRNNFLPLSSIRTLTTGRIALAGTYTSALDLSRLGDGTWFVGSDSLRGDATLAAGAVLLPGAGNMYRLAGDGNTLTVSATNLLTGTAGLVVGAPFSFGGNRFGASTVTLTAANDFSGPTSVNRGSTLKIQRGGVAGASLGTTSLLTVHSSAQVHAETANGTFFDSSGNPLNVDLRGGAVLKFYNGAISTAGADVNRWDDSTPMTWRQLDIEMQSRNVGASDVTTETVGAVTFTGGNIVRLTRGNTNSGNVTRLVVSSLTRVDQGTIEFTRSSALGGVDRFVVASGAPAPYYGMVSPYFVNHTDKTFVTYSSPNGFANVTYTTTDINAAGAGSLVNTAAATLTANRTMYALKQTGALSGAFDVVINSGGLIADFAATSATNASRLVFRDESSNLIEGLIFVDDSDTLIQSGTITANGLTKFGGGALRITSNNASTMTAGDVYVNRGELQLENAAALGGRPVYLGQSTLRLRASAATTFTSPVTLRDGYQYTEVSVNRSSGSGSDYTLTIPALTLGAYDDPVGRTMALTGDNSLNLQVSGVTTVNGNATLHTDTSGVDLFLDGGLTTTAPGSTIYKTGQALVRVAGTGTAAAGTKVVVEQGVLELRRNATGSGASTPIGSGANTTIVLNSGELRLRANNGGATFGGTSATAGGYAVVVNGNATITVDRYTGTTAGQRLRVGSLTIGSQTLTVSNAGSDWYFGVNGAVTMNGDPVFQMNASIPEFYGAVTGGRLIKQGGASLRMFGAADQVNYDGGSLIQQGWLYGRNGIGTGDLVVNPMGGAAVGRPEVLGASQKIVLRSSNRMLAMVGLNNGDAGTASVLPSALVSNLDLTRAPQGIIGLGGNYTLSLDMNDLFGPALPGVDNWYLGAISWADTYYRGDALGAGAGNIYRLGGGGGNMQINRNNATSAAGVPSGPTAHNLLTGTASVVVGLPSANLRSMASMTVAVGGTHDYTGGTLVHRGMALHLASPAADLGSGYQSGAGTGAIDLYGTLSLRNSGTLTNGSGGNVNTIITHPGSRIRLDSNDTGIGFSTSVEVADRWGDNAAIHLNGARFDVNGRNVAGTLTEQIGNVTVERGAVLRVDRNEATSRVYLLMNNLTRVGSGTVLLNQGDGMLPDQTTSDNAERYIISNPLNYPTVTNGMVAPWIVDQNDARFVTYNSSLAGGQQIGFQQVDFTTADPNLAGATDIVGVATATTLNANPTIWALKIAADFTKGTGSTVTIGSGGFIGGGGTTDVDYVFNDGVNNIEALMMFGGNTTFQGTITASQVTKFGWAEMILDRATPVFTVPLEVNNGSIRALQLGALTTAPITLNGGYADNGDDGSGLALVFAANIASAEEQVYTHGDVTSWDNNRVVFTMGGNDRIQRAGNFTLKSTGTAAPSVLQFRSDNDRSLAKVGTITFDADWAILNVLNNNGRGRSSTFKPDALVGTGKTIEQIGNGLMELSGLTTTLSNSTYTVSQGTLRVKDGASLGTDNTFVIGQGATLEIAAANFAPIGTTTVVQKWGSGERWSVEDARGTGDYTLPEGVTLQLNTNVLPTSPRTITLDGGSIEAFLYNDSVAQAVFRYLGPNVTVDLASDSFIGQNFYVGIDGVDAGREGFYPDLQPNGGTVQGGILVVQGAITGSGKTLTKIGRDMVILAGANSYGNTVVDQGILRLGATDTLPTAGILTTRFDGWVDMNGFNQTVGNLGTKDGDPSPGGVGLGYSGAILNSAYTDSVLTAGNADNYTYMGDINGNISFQKEGAGELKLGGVTLYNGTTVVNAGILHLANTAPVNLTAVGYTAVADGAGLIVPYGGANRLDDAGVDDLRTNGTFGNNVIIGFDVADTYSYTYTTLFPTATGFIKAGPGTIHLPTVASWPTLISLRGGTTSFVAGALGTTEPIDLQGSNTIVWSGVNTEDLSVRISPLPVASTTTFDVGANNVSFAAGLAGSLDSNLVKRGTGTLTLNGAAGYGGSTTIAQGPVVTTVADALSTTGILYMGSGTTVGTLTLGEDQTVAGLVSSVNNNSAASVIDIAAGKKLTVNGPVTLGVAIDQAHTQLTVTGGGTLEVNDVGGTFAVGVPMGTDLDNRVTLDMSALATFTANLGATGLLKIGDTGDNAGFGNRPTNMILAADSTITAGTITIGPSPHGATMNLKLGSGTNVINTDTLNLGTGNRDGGAFIFNGATGTVTLRDAAGTGRVNVNMGNAATQGTGYLAVNTFDTTGHAADLLIGTLATSPAGRGAAGTMTNTFSFDNGTLDIATINMAIAMGPNTSNSTINIGGGTVLLGASGTGSVSLATGANGTLNITGGTVTTSVDIGRNAGAGTAVLTLDGGTLDMTGKNIGSGANPINTVNLRSGTLANLGELNGGATLTKTTGGTLKLTGTHSYTGATDVQAGALIVNGSVASTANVSVQSGATLGGLGSIAGAVAVNAGGTLDAGDGTTPGTLTINNTLTFASTASAVFDIASDTSYDKVAGLTGLTYGGSLTVQAIGSPTWAAGQVYDLFNWTSGTPTGTFSTITLPTLPGSLAWKDYGGGTYFDYATGQIEIISAGPTTRVWNGGGSNDFWTSGSNWVGGNAPVAGDQVVFAGNVRLSPDNDNIGLVVGGLKFSGAGDPEGNAGAFTLGGNALTVAGKIDNQSTNAQTINHGITLAAAVNPADTGVVNVAAGAGTLTIAGNVGGTVGLIKTGDGTAALTASSNAYTGDTYVKAGTLQVDAGVNSNGTWADDTTVGLNAGDGGPSPSLVTLITEHVRQDTLKINDNGKVVITGTSGPSSTSVVNLLLIGDGSGGFTWSFGGLGGGAVVPVGGEVGGSASPVPEPATWALAAMALLALGYAARRRK